MKYISKITIKERERERNDWDDLLLLYFVKSIILFYYYYIFWKVRTLKNLRFIHSLDFDLHVFLSPGRACCGRNIFSKARERERYEIGKRDFSRARGGIVPISNVVMALRTGTFIHACKFFYYVVRYYYYTTVNSLLIERMLSF